MVTWNVATADPPDDVTTLLHLNSPKSPDLYVIGLQEVYSGPLRFVSDAVFDDPWSYLFMSLLAPQKYIKVSSIRMQGLLLLFFSKLEHVPFIRDVQATYTRTGLFGYWGNKGGVSIRLSFYGHTLCFLNCHLAAHMNYASERVDEFEYIMDMQSFDCKRAPTIVDHRLVFWFGDLNFRIQDHGMHFVRTCIDKQNYSLLWSKDQLIMMKQKEQVLQEFEEGPLDFQPTYKKHHHKNHESYSLFSLLTVCCICFYLYLFPTLQTLQHMLRKMYETPLVRLRAEGDWSADIDAMVVYSPLQPFPSSTWDWIGLYKVGFSSVSDYITYAWVKDDEVAFNEEVIQVYVSKEEIPVQGGDCVLCYYCNALKCIIGISEPFQVMNWK
uniref:Inositol polyphosphate-5-phosphatase Ka n=1 Tax=Neolamprologus brichardi TaxID=32507 RepID=A0A3Q4N9N2_NEOBR